MRIRIVILLALAVFLIWEVVTRSVAAYLATGSPETAIALRPTEPTALLNLAEKKLGDLDPKKGAIDANPDVPHVTQSEPDAGQVVQSKPDAPRGQLSLDTENQKSPLPPDDAFRTKTRAEVRSLAERALVKDPLNARAFRILGQLEVQTSDNKQAEKFMHAAAERSLFESNAVHWMMQKTYADKQYHSALKYADTLARTRQGVMGYVTPILSRMAENEHAAGELRDLLASNPSWRRDFFRLGFLDNISDARTPLELFLSLKDTEAPPTAEELGPYLNFLIGRKFYDLAYYTWLQFLPAEQLNKVGNLFNGSFDVVPSGLPFDWVWTNKPGAKIEIAAFPDQGKALQILFGPGRVELLGPTQLVMLPPGSYQFQAKYKADIVSQQGLLWRVTCASGEGKPLGESSILSSRDSSWKDFEFSFSVAKEDCPAQYVTLASGARSASEQFISGTISFANLKIVNESVVGPTKEHL